MGQLSFHTQEIQLKIVYCGPAQCGKTTSLRAVHRSIPEEERPELVSLPTDQERPLYYDFVPITLAQVGDFDVRVHVYTVPGEGHYRASREVVLRDTDGIVFVADSRRTMLDANLASFDELSEILYEQKTPLTRTPLVFQYNKRDLPDIVGIEDLDKQLNYLQAPTFPTVATTGQGVDDALQKIAALTVRDFVQKHRLG